MTTPEAALPLPLEGARQRTGRAGSAASAWGHWANRLSEGGLTATP